uniref:HTH_Tnp_Tc3_1 domain-containing protein n=1 Tax=Heterorhabditis bacteriophora TaxID=37862 RepID=A0A1I7WRT3_HETBA
MTTEIVNYFLTVQAAAASSSSTPRSSVSGTSSRSHRDNKVPLCHVYKVIRFYSFWKTCTSFHRIVTMIDKVNDDRNSNPDFKKRLFVQYLWRNAKAVEKARVQKEFDPRRQRLLRFVTDPAARKRFVEDDACTFAVILDDEYHSNSRMLPKLEKIEKIDRYTVKQIADVVKRSREVILNFLRHQEKYGTKKSSGRPSDLNGREKRTILHTASNSTTSIVGIRRTCGTDASESTIWTKLNKCPNNV